jgi:two-component system nitrogen regulation sensor histidine kinase NtrY
MTFLRTNSLERYLTLKLLLIGLGLPVTLGLWAWSANISPVVILLTEVLLLCTLFLVIKRIKTTILSAFERANLHVDAIVQEDYNQHVKPNFKHGKVADFHQQLIHLSQQLQAKKSNYNQHVFLVYQLIEQLDSPILVFNAKQQLSFANDAFYHLFGQHWQLFRHGSPALLGLTNTLDNDTHQKTAKQGWQFEDAEKNRRWQIRQSEFIDAGQIYQLLVFIDIESALRENQLNAWQQIIRVLSHEIRNSLTPVSSLAESLFDRTTNQRDKTALGVITDRCEHLQDFVERYSSLSKSINLNCQWLAVDALTQRLCELFEALKIQFEISVDIIWADSVFIEQVLINLIKNAEQANADVVQFVFAKADNNCIIKVIDNGHGFANLDNLFIPLYTTKAQGQGIGLNFCRNIVEQHQGTIELVNNGVEKGVTVTIKLPCPALS